MQTTKANALYAGADLHGNNVFLSLCDKEGDNVFRRRVKATLEAVNAALDPFWERIVVLGVESTFNWYWFVDGLREQGRNVKLGNPAKMEHYKGIKITNDLTDADWLAEQLRVGIFPESYIYPKETRPVRDALRRRQLFVRRRTQVLLSFGGLLITVEPPIAGRPPYRSLRAVFPHKAPRFKLSLLPHQCGSIKLQTVSYLASLLWLDTALYTAPTYR